MRTGGLLALYIASTLGIYGVLRLQGAAGPVNWSGVVVWVALLWFVARGSKVAWGIALVLTVLGVLSLAFLGVDPSAASVGIVALLSLQLVAMIALRPVGTRPPTAPH